MNAATLTASNKHHAHGAASGNTDKFLSFCLGREEYALAILAVREIIGLIDITALPQTPPYVKGVINLRGKIIPVIELRTKFGLKPVDYTDQTCVIVVDASISDSAEPLQVGLIVDEVREVLDIANTAIEPPPSFGCAVPVDYIHGIGKVRDKVVVLLNVAKVIGGDAGMLGLSQESARSTLQAV
ncbi:MAG: purine-binding chemotaxis protein CheW [Phycisphaeraceae bacterium]|nr:purine-binding chemotaxis protein CheW [Phycisphaeraceae bacterium]